MESKIKIFNKIKLSLAAKNAISYFGLFLITISLISYIILRNSSKEIIKSSEKNLIHSSERVGLIFSKYIIDLKYDITHISQSPLLELFLDSGSNDIKSLLEKEYLSLLKSKPHFSQIRIIGLENNGKELVRVEKKDEEFVIVDISQLQEKGDREYFKNTISLPPDSIYISPIDLNKEFGEISIPYTPTIRMAYPLYVNNGVEAIVVINANISSLINSLSKLADANVRVSLLNGDGYYLSHEEQARMFEFEFGNPSSYLETFGKLPENMFEVNSSVIKIKDFLLRFEKLYYPKNDYSVYVMVSADRRLLLANYYAWRNNSLMIILGFGMLSLMIAMAIMKRQVSELKNISQTIKQFSVRLEEIELPSQRNDEIGVLAQSFNYMTKLVLENIKKLKHSKLEAETAVMEKQQFIENMSHEIRNPIHTIMGLSDLLYKNKHLPHQLKLIESIRLSTLNLQSLVNDVLDYKKVLKREITLEPSWIDLAEFMNDFIKIFVFSASLKKIELKLDIDATFRESEFYLDSARLSQLLTNLVSNAIKYTEEKGRVAISLQRQQDNEWNHEIIFNVIDNGKGIEESEILAIRNRYYTGNKDSVPRDSFGIGLSIVIALLQLHKSELKIKSQVLKGSEFYFSLKLPERTKSHRAEAKRNLNINSVLKSKRILIIEDDVQIIDLYKYHFKALFEKVSYVTKANEVKDLNFSSFDILICDYKIGNINLPNVLNNKREYLQSKSLIYIVSAVARDEIYLENLNFIHIQKPFSAKELIDRISEDMSRLLFEAPDFTSIVDDYDGNIEKIHNALTLLYDEWKLMQERSSKAFNNSDKEALSSLIHKIITSVRRLKLNDFENFLLSLENISQGDLSNEAVPFNLRMEYYLFKIKENIELL